MKRAVFPACDTDDAAIEPRRRRLVDLKFPPQEMFPRAERGEVEERHVDRLFQLPDGISADEDGGDMGLPGRTAGQFGQKPRNVLLFALELSWRWEILRCFGEDEHAVIADDLHQSVAAGRVFKASLSRGNIRPPASRQPVARQGYAIEVAAVLRGSAWFEQPLGQRDQFGLANLPSVKALAG